MSSRRVATQNWLRTPDDDLRPLNFGVAMARWHTWDKLTWRVLVKVATFLTCSAEKERELKAVLIMDFKTVIAILVGM